MRKTFGDIQGGGVHFTLTVRICNSAIGILKVVAIWSHNKRSSLKEI